MVTDKTIMQRELNSPRGPTPTPPKVTMNSPRGPTPTPPKVAMNSPRVPISPQPSSPNPHAKVANSQNYAQQLVSKKTYREAQRPTPESFASNDVRNRPAEHLDISSGFSGLVKATRTRDKRSGSVVESHGPKHGVYHLSPTRPTTRSLEP
jgi:hypothetical protein